MLRIALAAVAALCSVTLLSAPAATAQPKFCEHHGTGAGNIYIHACASGGGGGGPDPFFAVLRDEDGNVVHGANGKPTKVCRSACGKLDPKDRIQNP